MNAHVPPNHALQARLTRELKGDVLFDRASRGRYATDASIYQIEPVGVVVPRSQADVEIAAQIAREAGVSVLPRGGGTSQSGQTVGRSLVIDFTKHLNRVIETDPTARSCLVEPGIVLDTLNRQLEPTGLWFPVDVSTSSRATIGGMTANNSCGTRSIRYGIMRDNVQAIDALLADGAKLRFGEDSPRTDPLLRDLLALGEREAAHIRGAFPDVTRRVGGYLVDALVPPPPGSNTRLNPATLLCGSEGTLAISQRIRLKLSPRPKNKALGICHFATFRKAMEAPQHIVELGPVAVEVVDRTLIELARDIAMFRPVMETYVRGKPDALLFVEFAEENQAENLRRLDRLAELMADLGHPDAVVKVTDAAGQKAVWDVRAAGLNIMMSMRTEGKPVSFIEDCAVPLEHLADYTERLTAVFDKHGTKGTWYAHASVGCLHVRPVLNLKLEKDAATMRAIAEEAFAMVKAYKGSHSGEHGDGLVRSEFHELMYGRRTVEIFEEVKDRFDPKGLLNPGKIVRAPRMNDRTLFRYQPDYGVADVTTALDWSAWTGSAGGLQGAIEMCNNNGECRKVQGGVMCPSFRVTRDERDVTRGRANTLRLGISGQLEGGLASDALADAMSLCVSCKACRRECPTGVDMARLKIEVQAARNRAYGLSLGERLVAWLPHYAPYASRVAPLMNMRNWLPGAAALAQRVTGLSAERKLPAWRSNRFRLDGSIGPENGRPVAIFADTFNTYFEPQNLWDACDVLVHLGYRVELLGGGRGRPVCCGRTFLSAGLVDEAKVEAARLLAAASPLIARGVPIVGLEPSCVLTTRDEHQAMHLDAEKLATHTFLFEEFLAREMKTGHIEGPIGRSEGGRVLLHGHCHQKAFGVMGSIAEALSLVEGLQVETVETSCCGMAGAFGYGADTYETSMAMGELSLLPAVRKASETTIIAADGFSCRHQIGDGTRRRARHVASVLADAMRG